jgi:hypothetical protein
MTRPEMHIHHADTSEDEIREMTDEEYSQYLVDIEPKGSAPE